MEYSPSTPFFLPSTPLIEDYSDVGLSVVPTSTPRIASPRIASDVGMTGTPHIASDVGMTGTPLLLSTPQWISDDDLDLDLTTEISQPNSPPSAQLVTPLPRIRRPIMELVLPLPLLELQTPESRVAVIHRRTSERTINNTQQASFARLFQSSKRRLADAFAEMMVEHFKRTRIAD